MKPFYYVVCEFQCDGGSAFCLYARPHTLYTSTFSVCEVELICNHCVVHVPFRDGGFGRERLGMVALRSVAAAWNSPCGNSAYRTPRSVLYR